MSPELKTHLTCVVCAAAQTYIGIRTLRSSSVKQERVMTSNIEIFTARESPSTGTGEGRAEEGEEKDEDDEEDREEEEEQEEEEEGGEEWGGEEDEKRRRRSQGLLLSSEF